MGSTVVSFIRGKLWFLFRLQKKKKFKVSSALRICMLSLSDCESLLLLSFILESIACNPVWILSVRLRCCVRDLQRLAGSCPSLGSPRDEWVHFTGVAWLGSASWSWEWWRRDHPCRLGFSWGAGEGQEEGKKCVELVIQKCVMFAVLDLLLLKEL